MKENVPHESLWGIFQQIFSIRLFSGSGSPEGEEAIRKMCLPMEII